MEVNELYVFGRAEAGCGDSEPEYSLDGHWRTRFAGGSGRFVQTLEATQSLKVGSPYEIVWCPNWKSEDQLRALPNLLEESSYDTYQFDIL